MAKIHQISASDGGVPKLPLGKSMVDTNGLVGDRQDDTEHHGGPERALCLYSLEVIERLKGEGHPIEPGYAGENLTISGLAWEEMVPGTRWRVGPTVEIEIASYTNPCYKNAAWFVDGDYTRMMQSRHPGESRVYARVLVPGTVEVDDAVTAI